jgi:GH15 family glucan-1,4-alpha-glucosidase
MNIYDHSIEVILKNQDEGGAYIACPTFLNYRYCWLRDGSFIAYAMDQVGKFDSAEKFYRWVGKAINRYASKVDVLEEQLTSGKKPDQRGILNTRFTMDGFEESSESGWGNFQVDGYGSWLWGLAEHVRRTQNYALLEDLIEPITTTLRYLQFVWQLPNYDCWEEHPEYLHPYSLATIYGGVAAIAELQAAGKLTACKIDAAGFAVEVNAFIAKNAILNGRFIKHLWPGENGKSPLPVKESGVDASLLGLAVPYHAFDLTHAAIIETVQIVEKDLHFLQGGVYRYKEDVYFGGGEWILLSAWLGWYYALTGKKAQAQELLNWIERSAKANGDLPEQVNDHALTPAEYPVWVKKWGPVASPLLWSHAMYLILYKTLEEEPL